MSPSLKPYQQDGAAHLLGAFAEALRIDRVRLLLDEPGLGKTVTGAACLAMRDAINGEHRPAIVVCPSSVRATWRAELAKWAPDLTVILPDDVASIRAPGPGEVVVLGHDQLGCLRPPKVPPPTAPQKARDAYAKAKTLHDKRAAAIDSLKRLAPHTDLVVDEAQYAKGAASARSLVLESLWKKGCRAVGGVLWILTGTIDPCSPLDLFVVLEVAGIANRIWPGGLVEFAAHFGGTYHSRGNRWDFPELPPGGSVLQGPVGERMARYVLLRRQEEVLGELPQPTARVTLCPVNGALASLGDAVLRAAVTCAHDDPDLAAGLILDALSGRSAAHFTLDLSLLSELRAKLAEVKVAAMLARLAQLEAEGIGTLACPIVVYSEHRAPSEALRGRPDWGFITGADSPKQRQQTILDLEAGLLRGVAITGAGRTGITLIAAAYMLKVSLSLSDADEQQTEKRIIRYGQTRPVVIESIIADHPVEHLVLGVLARKAARAAATWAR